MGSRRVLIAGIGNIFLGDDGFGVEVVTRLAGSGLPEGVEVKDFGIRGMDLAYALQDDYDLVVFVDATPRGEEPGTVYLIEPEIEEDGEVSLDTHGMDPVKVIKLARALGATAREVAAGLAAAQALPALIGALLGIADHGDAGALLHPVVPLDNLQITISRDDPLRREVVHPVQDRVVK